MAERISSGFLNLNKPAGMTSYDVIRHLKQFLPYRTKIGHGGILDKPAEGVLPVGVGKATRLFEYFQLLPKHYRGTILLGVLTDTLDLNGSLVETDPLVAIPDPVELNRLAEGEFTGTITQVPPLYSSLKQGGQPLYRLAMEGREVEPKPRQVQIYRLTITEVETIPAERLKQEVADREEGPDLSSADLAAELPLVHFETLCGGGTYARALARDIARRAGTVGILYHLTRTRVGPFTLEEATTPQDLNSPEAVRERLLPPLVAAFPERCVLATDYELARLLQGNLVPIDLRRLGFNIEQFYPPAYLAAWRELPEPALHPEQDDLPVFMVDSEGNLAQVCKMVGEPIGGRVNLRIRKNLAG